MLINYIPYAHDLPPKWYQMARHMSFSVTKIVFYVETPKFYCNFVFRNLPSRCEGITKYQQKAIWI